MSATRAEHLIVAGSEQRQLTLLEQSPKPPTVTGLSAFTIVPVSADIAQRFYTDGALNPMLHDFEVKALWRRARPGAPWQCEARKLQARLHDDAAATRFPLCDVTLPGRLNAPVPPFRTRSEVRERQIDSYGDKEDI